MKPSLRDSAKKAIVWSAWLNLVRDLAQFAQMLVLVRLLDPAIYGTAALATTVVNFIGLLSFQHFVAHVLQVRGDAEVDYHQHFTAGLAVNGVLFVVTNAIAAAAGETERYAELRPLLHLLSLTFLLSVPVDLRMKMLERNLDWKRLRGLQMAGVAISITCGIGMALAGFGVYSLVVPSLLASTVFVGDLLVAGWWPRLRWALAGYRDTISFGLQRASSNALNGGRALLQSSLIAQHFDMSVLGVFGRAEGLANMFCGKVAQEAGGALYPVLTRAQAGSEQFQRMSGLVLQGVTWVVVPVAIVMAVEADGIVRILFGPKWTGVIALLPLAMAVGVATSVGATAYRLLLANNQARLCLRADVVAFALVAGSMLAFISFGLIPYLIGAIVAHTAVALILITLLYRTGGVHAGGLVSAFVPSFAAAAAGALAWISFRSLGTWDLHMVVQVGSGVLVFGASYLAVLRFGFRGALAELANCLPGAARLRGLLRI